MEEFINLYQGGITPSSFTKLSKYAPSLVSNHRDDIIRLVMGVFEDLVEECVRRCSMTIWTFII